MPDNLPILVPNDAVMELQKPAQEHNVSTEALIIEVLEDCVEGDRGTTKSARSTRNPGSPGSGP